MSNAHNDRTDVLKSNLEMVKTAVDLWKDYINIPTDFFEDKLRNVQTRGTGIHLIAIALANDIVVWTRTNLKTYLRTLAGIIQENKYTSFHSWSSEVVGMMLRIMSSKTEWKNEYETLNAQLRNVLNKSDDSKFLQCLEHIQIHYPGILDGYVTEIYKKLIQNKSNNNLVRICLKNILRHVETSKEPLNHGLDLTELLKIKDADVQLLTLRIIDRYISFDAKYVFIIKDVDKLNKNSNNTSVREAVYQIFITFYNKYIINGEINNEETTKIVKSTLLSGLIDNDPDLQRKIHDFWTNNSDLSTDALKNRFVNLLSSLYSPEIEAYYLGYSTYFLLEASKGSSEYEKTIYDHPLHECNFEEVKLDLNWRSRHSSFSPMFSDSFASQFDRNVTPLEGVREAARQFSPTQAGEVTQTSSSFMFTLTQTPSTSDVTRRTENVVAMKNENRKTFVRHSRKFVRDKTYYSKLFAKKEVDKKVKREAFLKERIKRRDAEVAIHRKYRRGDFPDVVIPYSAILSPLQALVRVRIYSCIT